MRHYVDTDVGVVRSENQDRAAVFELGSVTFAVLCDGMGGHSGGSYASQIAVSVCEKEFRSRFPVGASIDEINAWFKKTIDSAKMEMTLFANGDESLLDMGTTITCAIITNNKVIIYNIGDSRTYVYNGYLNQITVDHNLRNYYIKNYGYSEEKAATLTGATALTYALGPKKKMLIDTYVIDRNEYIDSIILTSDGIHDYITKPFFEHVIQSDEDLDIKTSALIKQAKRGKSSDNLTAIIVEVS